VREDSDKVELKSSRLSASVDKETAIYINGDGSQVVSKKDFNEGLQFIEGAQGDQRGRSSIRLQGDYTPGVDGPLAFEVNELHAVGYPTTASIDDSPTPTATPNSEYRFPKFLFTAVTGKLVKFSIQTKVPEPSFQVVRKLSLYRNIYLPGTNINFMKKTFSLLLVLVFSLSWAGGTTLVQKIDHGVLIVSDLAVVKIQPWSLRTVRVEAAPGTTIPEKKAWQ